MRGPCTRWEVSAYAANDPFRGHCTRDALSSVFTRTVSAIAPLTDRLDFAPMPVNPKRFRSTFGTRLAEEGAGRAEIAERLGHTDLQNVDVYFEASPAIVDSIDAAMGRQLAPLARAFRGRLVEDEEHSTHKGAPGSRIIDFRVSGKPLASCAGKAQGCGFNKPVACYTCFKFEPWLDGPHEKVLKRLEEDREKWAYDQRLAAINDDAIEAVREVIAECAQVRAQQFPEGPRERNLSPVHSQSGSRATSEPQRLHRALPAFRSARCARAVRQAHLGHRPLQRAQQGTPSRFQHYGGRQ